MTSFHPIVPTRSPTDHHWDQNEISLDPQPLEGPELQNNQHKKIVPRLNHKKDFPYIPTLDIGEETNHINYGGNWDSL